MPGSLASFGRLIGRMVGRRKSYQWEKEGRGNRSEKREDKKIFSWFGFLKPEFIPFSIFQKNFVFAILNSDFDF